MKIIISTELFVLLPIITLVVLVTDDKADDKTTNSSSEAPSPSPALFATPFPVFKV